MIVTPFFARRFHPRGDRGSFRVCAARIDNCEPRFMPFRPLRLQQRRAPTPKPGAVVITRSAVSVFRNQNPARASKPPLTTQRRKPTRIFSFESTQIHF